MNHKSVFKGSRVPKESFGQNCLSKNKIKACKIDVWIQRVERWWDWNQDLWKSSLAKKSFRLFHWVKKVIFKSVLARYMLMQNMAGIFRRLILTASVVMQVSRAKFCVQFYRWMSEVIPADVNVISWQHLEAFGVNTDFDIAGVESSLRVTRCKQIIQGLPEHNYVVLKYLICFLHMVSIGSISEGRTFFPLFKAVVTN